MRELAKCDYRVETDDQTNYYCRHSSVHVKGNLVNSAICRYCPQRTIACLSPRPVPESTELTAIVEASLIQKVWNFTSAVAAFVSDGMTLVDNETYAARMAVCETCEYRSNNQCRKCGCNLTLKASGRAFECPIGKWQMVEVAEQG
ncbi:MAG: DUF6171 family protein [Planctomycetaceae bacterium]